MLRSLHLNRHCWGHRRERLELRSPYYCIFNSGSRMVPPGVPCISYNRSVLILCTILYACKICVASLKVRCPDSRTLNRWYPPLRVRVPPPVWLENWILLIQNASVTFITDACVLRTFGHDRKFNTCARSGQIELHGQIVRKY